MIRKSSVKLLASAARTVTTASESLRNRYHRGIAVFLDITVVGTAATLALKIRGYDPLSGKTVELLADATPIDATGTYAFLLHPDAGTAADGVRVSAPFVLPTKFDIQVVHSNTESCTYSVAADLLP